MGSVQVWHGASTALADGLGAWMAHRGADPFVRDIVCVPGRGIERWLAQSLSARFGICAGVDFPRLQTLTDTVLATNLPAGADGRPHDPWAPGALVWSVLDHLDAVADRPECEVLRRHLDAEHTRRFVVAERAAQRLHRYARIRPTLVQAWTRGEDVDALGRPLSEIDRWQAFLWRELGDALEAPDPATRMASLPGDLSDPTVVDLPDRLAVFGPTDLTAADIAVLDALGQHREVSLWLPHPSPELWEEAEPAQDASHLAPTRNPLLERVGHEARTTPVLLARSGWACSPVSEDPPPPTSLLQRLQTSVRRNEPFEAADVDPSDDSVTFHRCHGPDRQVEILREVLLGLLTDDPTLEPRDIVVQCPAIDTWAPLLHAAFTPPPEGATHPGQSLPVHLADRSLREANPVLEVVSALLHLAVGRASRSELLDLCSSAPVAHRFGWDNEGQIDELTDLVDRAVVRWGVDEAFRSGFRLTHGQGTWAHAADRLTVSLLRGEDDEHFAGPAVPVADIEPSSAGLIGRFAEFVDRVAGFVHAAQEQWTLPEWIDLCHRIIDGLAAAPPLDRWQIGHAHGVLADISDASNRTPTATMSAADMLALLHDAFSGRRIRTSFGTGAITVCTLEPMRTVPHRAVILLGLDDGVFPRVRRNDGDDLLLAAPQLGDPDPRAADRQSFLDAVLAASERLVVIHSGFDERTNQPVAPAPPVQDLLDACVACGASQENITRRHPLQSHGESDLIAPAFSFDRHALDAARACRAPERLPAHAPFASTRLAPMAGSDDIVAVDLADLQQFFKDPTTHLLRSRGGLDTWRTEPPSEQLPLESDPLQRWHIRTRVLRAARNDVDPVAVRDVERRRGDVPPGELGTNAIDDAVRHAGRTLRHIERWATGDATSLTGAVTIGRFEVFGTVGQIHDRCIVDASASRVTGARRIAAWIKLLALTAWQPTPWEAVVISAHGSVRLGPVAESTARAVLQDLLRIHWRGMHEPLLWTPGLATEFLAEEQLTWDTRRMEYERSPGLQCFVAASGDLTVTDDFQKTTTQVFEPLERHERPLG